MTKDKNIFKFKNKKGKNKELKELKWLQNILEKENEFLTQMKYPFDLKSYKKMFQQQKNSSEYSKEEELYWILRRLVKKDIYKSFKEKFNKEEAHLRLSVEREEEQGKNRYGDSITTKYYIIEGEIYHHIPSQLEDYDHHILNSEFQIPICYKYKIAKKDWKWFEVIERSKITTNIAFTSTTYLSEANSLVLLKYQDLEFAFYGSQVEGFHSSHDYQGDASLPYDLEDHYLPNLEVIEDLRFDELTRDGAHRFIIKKRSEKDE